MTETIGGMVVSKTYTAFHVASGGERTEITEQCTASGSVYGDAGNLKTIRVYHSETLDGYAAGRLKQQENPDGTLVSYTYEAGTYDSGSRSFTSGTGDDIREIAVYGTSAAPTGIAFKTLKKTTIRNRFGYTCHRSC